MPRGFCLTLSQKRLRQALVTDDSSPLMVFSSRTGFRDGGRIVMKALRQRGPLL
jgi:hypothetical protein